MGEENELKRITHEEFVAEVFKVKLVMKLHCIRDKYVTGKTNISVRHNFIINMNGEFSMTLQIVLKEDK